MHARKHKFTNNSKHNFRLYSNPDHQPDCSYVTDDELANSIEGIWQSSNGTVNVDYSFSFPAFWWLTDPNLSRFHSRSVDDITESEFQGTVDSVLANLVAAYNGIFNLNKISKSFKTTFSPFYRGIYFVQAASEQDFINDGEGSFTVIRYDNNGYLKQAVTYLPTDLSIYNTSFNIWQPWWAAYAISLSTNQALGCGMIQNYPDILAKLQNIPDGVFCTELDNPDAISTNISSCMQNCAIPYANSPGPLDVRSMQLAYIQGNYNTGYDKLHHYLINGAEWAILFSFLSFAYSAIENTVSATKCRKNGVTFPRKYIQTLLNIATLGMFIGLDAPDYVTIVFALVSALKIVIPDKAWDSVPSFVKFLSQKKVDFIRDSRYPLYALAFTTSIAEGQKAGPLFWAWFVTLYATGVGGLLGNAPSLLISPLLNFCLDSTLTKMMPADDRAVPWPPHQVNEVELADRSGAAKQQPASAQIEEVKEGEEEERPSQYLPNDKVNRNQFYQPSVPDVKEEEVNQSGFDVDDVQPWSRPT